MKPYMLRRMKKDIALPEKTEFTVWLKLTPYQVQIFVMLQEGFSYAVTIFLCIYLILFVMQKKLYTTFLKTNTFYKGDKGAVLVASMVQLIFR